MIVTNPTFEHWTKIIPNRQLIYWNFDDNALYQPRRASQIKTWEDQLVDRARMILCASRELYQRSVARFPEHSEKIWHFPNAVRNEWIAERPLPLLNRGTIGYVGNLGDRVDWTLVRAVALASPHLRFIFVGGLEPAGPSRAPEWLETRNEVSSLPNVEMPGPVPQADVWRWYRAFDIGWMPYDVCHPFNIASSPTKIFDALGAGRPFVSTAVPECLLYADYVSILHMPDDARELFAKCSQQWTVDRAARQLEFARQNDWDTRARWLRDQLDHRGSETSMLTGTETS